MAENNFNTQGGYFAPANYFKVEAGGSHDENPNGGVQIGVDSQGIPNMLEEGEPVYDDYVFSDNIKAEKDILSQYNLPTKYAGKLYSEIADAYVDEAEERPLDSVSNNGLRSMLSRLADAQEEQKQKQQEKELEDELSKLSPEELAELEAMLAEQASAEQQIEQAAPVDGQVPVQEEVPMEQQEAMPIMANGGLLRRFDGGTPGEVTSSNGGGHGGGARVQPETPYTGEILPDYRLRPFIDLSDTRFGRGLNRFNNTLFGRVVNFVTPDSKNTASFAPAIKPAAGVSKIMDDAYRILEADKAYEGAYRAADAIEKADAIAKGSGVGKKIWNVAKYFVDPSAVWRSGWKPQGFWGKAAKGAVGVLHSGAVGRAEAGAIVRAIGKGVDISKSSKSEDFSVDPFSGRNYKKDGGEIINRYDNAIIDVVDGDDGGNGRVMPTAIFPFTPEYWSQQTGGPDYSGLFFNPILNFGPASQTTGYAGPVVSGQAAASPASSAASGAGTKAGAKAKPASSIKQKVRTPVEAIMSDDSLLSGARVNKDRYKKTRLGYYRDGEYGTPMPGIVTSEQMKENMRRKYGDKRADITGEENKFPIWPRYSGIAHNLATALFNMSQAPDKYDFPVLRARYPSTAQPNLTNMTYRPIDVNQPINNILSSNAGTARAIMNSGAGPSTGAMLAALDNKTTGNIGAAYEQVASANNQQRNAVIAANNQAAMQRAGFQYQLDRDRANAESIADRINQQTAMRQQALNYQGQQNWANAVSTPLGYVNQAMSDIGNENLAYNMVNEVYPYKYDSKSNIGYHRGSKGGLLLLKKYKK